VRCLLRYWLVGKKNVAPPENPQSRLYYGIARPFAVNLRFFQQGCEVMKFFEKLAVFFCFRKTKKAPMKKSGRGLQSIRLIIALALSAALIIYVAGKMNGESISVQIPFGKLVIIFKHS